MLILNSSREGAIKDFALAVKIFSQSGFSINWDESCGTPYQSIEFEVLIISSIQLKFSLKEEKVKSILTLYLFSTCTGMRSERFS